MVFASGQGIADALNGLIVQVVMVGLGSLVAVTVLAVALSRLLERHSPSDDEVLRQALADHQRTIARKQARAARRADRAAVQPAPVAPVRHPNPFLGPPTDR